MTHVPGVTGDSNGPAAIGPMSEDHTAVAQKIGGCLPGIHDAARKRASGAT